MPPGLVPVSTPPSQPSPSDPNYSVFNWVDSPKNNRSSNRTHPTNSFICKHASISTPHTYTIKSFVLCFSGSKRWLLHCSGFPETSACRPTQTYDFRTIRIVLCMIRRVTRAIRASKPRTNNSKPVSAGQLKLTTWIFFVAYLSLAL